MLSRLSPDRTSDSRSACQPLSLTCSKLAMRFTRFASCCTTHVIGILLRAQGSQGIRLFVRVEPEREEARHARHDDVGHGHNHNEGEDERAKHGRKPAEKRLGEGKDRGRERKNGDPRDDGHLVTWWRGLTGPRRKREPCLQPSADPYVLLVDEGLYPAQPRSSFVGLLPPLEVARVVELEEDLELVVVRVAGPHDVGPEIARKLLHGTENARDPLLELLLFPGFYPS